MKKMVREKSLFHSLKGLGLSSVILLVSIQGQATATISNNKEITSSPTNPQVEAPAVGQPMVEPAAEEISPVNPVEDVSLVIRLRERRVYVYRGDRVQASYPIAIGKKGWETPTGSFKVLNMMRDPSWEHPWTGQVIDPGPNNPLGTRWIGFWTDGKNFIGFHGTPNEQLIGQAVSHGCIRMRNRDVQALYELVTVGTPVTVQP